MPFAKSLPTWSFATDLLRIPTVALTLLCCSERWERGKWDFYHKQDSPDLCLNDKGEEMKQPNAYHQSIYRSKSMTNMIVTTPVNVTGASVTNTVVNHAEKPKMFFYLRTLNLARFLNETVPQVEPPKEGQPFNAQVVQAVL
ncbi:hypothetical protein Tco_0211378 [Tanacetum coccineum]